MTFYKILHIQATKYPPAKNIVRINKSAPEMNNHVRFALSPRKLKAIKMGKRTIAYLGSPEKVPLDTGSKNARMEKIR